MKMFCELKHRDIFELDGITYIKVTTHLHRGNAVPVHDASLLNIHILPQVLVEHVGVWKR